MKKCPHCAEEIQDIAKKCRFCGEWLNEDATNAVVEKKETQTANNENKKTNNYSISKKGFISNLFSGRLGRLDYFLFVLFVIFGISIISSIFLVSISSAVNNEISEGVGLFAVIINIICILFFVLLAHIRRLHDIEMSGWWVLILPIPIINLVMAIILLFKKGTIGPNKFGETNNGGFFKRILNLQ